MEGPPGDVPQEGCPVSGSLVDGETLDGDLVDVGLELAPEIAGAAASGDPDACRMNAQFPDGVERLAQAEEHALHERPGHMSQGVAGGEPEEHPARVRVGVRGALARQVGEEQQALGPGRDLLGVCDQRGVVVAGHVAPPPE